MRDITRHAFDRGKRRLKLNKQALRNTTDRALREGVTHSETVGQLNKYFTKLYFKNQAANNIRLWGEHVYIFSYETLITVFPIPHIFRTRIKKIMARRHKNK